MEPNLFLYNHLVRFDKPKPFKKRRRMRSFNDMYSVSQDMGLNVFTSKCKYYSPKKHMLRKAWIYDDGKWKQTKNQKVDILFYLGRTKNIYSEIKKLDKKINIPIVNDMELEVLCDDKLLTHILFPEYLPKTLLINDHYQLFKVLRHIKSDYVVLKPRFGSLGRNVRIIHKKNLVNGIRKDTVIQEFIDSTRGIPELGIKGVHDMRLVMINGKIDHAYVREPTGDSLLSNASLGASKKFVETEDIPNKILKVVKKVDFALVDYKPRIYSTDIMINEEGQPKVVELNSKPGTLYYDNALDIRKRFFKNQFKALINHEY